MRWLALFMLLAPACAARGCLGSRSDCTNASSDKYFFPRGSVGEQFKHFDQDEFVRSWYSKHLRAMSEPSLSCNPAGAETYRFLWLRTWGHPIAVRVAGLSTSGVISAVELDGAGGYGPGKILRSVNRQLSRDESDQVWAGLKAVDFWKMPSRLPKSGMDGAQWIMEGRKAEQYHVVDRWSPQEGQYREFCLLLVKLAGVLPSEELPPGGIY
jgi:hypothetical protein